MNDPTEERIFRLYRRTEIPSELAMQMADLRHTLLSLAQEVEVLRTMLGDETSYQRLRVKRMLDDHSSQGPSPERHHSSYRYTLDEDEFLRQQLGFGDEEVQDFRTKAREMSALT